MEKYKEINGKTYRKNKNNETVCIADFVIKNAVNKEIRNIQGEVTSKSCEITVFTGKKICKIEISVEDINSGKFLSKYEFLITTPERGAKQDIIYIIKSKANENATVIRTEINRLGFDRLQDGRVIYCAGDKVISENGFEDILISSELSNKYHFDILNENVRDEKNEADAALVHANIDNPYSGIIFATNLAGIMRSILFEAGANPSFIVYLMGKSQSRKTALARILCCIYNRDRSANESEVGISRVNGTVSKTEYNIDEYRDATYILDDLYKDSDKKKRSENERSLRNAIRNAADFSPRQKNGKEARVNSQLIVTAEYLLPDKTDVGRCLVVNVKHPIDSRSLTECQAEPLKLPTAFYYYIRWLCKKYDVVVAELKEKFKMHRSKINLSGEKYTRFSDTRFILTYLYELFLKYAESKGVIECTTQEKILGRFSANLERIIEYQYEIMSELEKKEIGSVNFSNELIRIVQNEGLGVRGSQIFKKGKCLYIRCEYFRRKLYEKYEKAFSSKAITKYFDNRCILKKSSDDKNTIKYGEKGERYLVLYINNIIEDAESKAAEIKNLFF